jgi:hypothetical protein
MKSAQALSSITISQANVAADACSGIVNCVNVHDNFAIVTPAPLATQNINVDGSQNIDQSNTCSDDDLGVPGAINCVNDALTFGNDFAVLHDGAADVQVDSFEQASTQANDCTLFDDCTNVAGNALVIAAEDNDGLAVTNVDAFVGSSVQTTTQGNDCHGTAPPDPQCANFDLNGIAIAALVDGDVNLDDSTQTANSNNACDDETVTCGNIGTNTLVMAAVGENAETDLGTNLQTTDKTNNCVNAGTSCGNLAVNLATLATTDDAVVDISDNTQTSGQDNTCDTGAICDNQAINNYVAAATGTSTITGSNAQSKVQSNACSGPAFCTNIGDNQNVVLADDDSSVSSVASQSDSGTNTCDALAVCGNFGANDNFVAGEADASIASTSTQSNDFTNTCTDSICGNSNANVNDVAGGAGAEFESETTQTSSNTNECQGFLASCNNSGANQVVIG